MIEEKKSLFTNMSFLHRTSPYTYT